MPAAADPISRASLARILQSLLTAELAAVRRRAPLVSGVRPGPAGPWPEDLQIVGDGPVALGCDSLEIMWLAGAANEMFHLHEAGNETVLLSAMSFGDWLDHIIAAWRAGVSNITFTTSGSTGTPKRCTHTLAHLQTETRFLADTFATRRRIVALTPAHHIYGILFIALLADRLDIAVLDAGDATANAIRPGDLVVSFPDRWSWLSRFVPAWHDDVDGVVSTAPCPSALIAALTAHGLAKMTEVYGSSETAGIGLRVYPDDAYHLMPHWRFDTPIDPAAPTLIHVSGSQFHLMDQVSIRADAGFALTGRRDGALQVGGINVHPDRIAALLRARPGIADARVRLMRPEEGNRLKAFIVPDQGACEHELRLDLEAWNAAHLTAVEQPKAFTFGSSLPCNEMGKAADW